MSRGNCNDPRIKTLPLLAIMGLGLGWTVAVQAEEETMGKHQIAGVDISGGITTFLQSTDGAPQNTTALSYSLDLGLEAPVGEHGKAVVALEAGDGLGVDATLGSLSTANYDAFYVKHFDVRHFSQTAQQIYGGGHGGFNAEPFLKRRHSRDFSAAPEKPYRSSRNFTPVPAGDIYRMVL